MVKFATNAGKITQVLDAIPWVRCASGNVLVQNLGHNLHKKCKSFRFGNSLSEKQLFTFGLFLDV